MVEKSVAILHLPAGRQVWHDWKRPERKRKNLISLGVKEGVAYAWSRSRRGGWAIAQSPILGTTITVSLLKRKGYLSLTDHYSKVKFLI